MVVISLFRGRNMPIKRLRNTYRNFIRNYLSKSGAWGFFMYRIGSWPFFYGMSQKVTKMWDNQLTAFLVFSRIAAGW